MAGVRIATFLVLAVAGLAQSTCACNCKALTKDERAMFLSHSEDCLAESKADPKLVADLFKGELSDDPILKKHVLCILLKCKMITKDGKLQKSAVLGKLPKSLDPITATKIVETCGESKGETPEEIAWNFFKCGLEKKSMLFYSPGDKRDDVEPMMASLKNENEGVTIPSALGTEMGSGTTKDH